MGIQVTRENFEAMVHFWRVIGHMLGIHDEYNLCTDSWETTKPRLELMLTKIYRPNLEKTPEEFNFMADTLIDGLWCFNPFLTTGGFLYFAKFMSGCRGYVYLNSDAKMLEESAETLVKVESLHWYDRLMLWFQFTTHTYLLNFAIIRWYLNLQIHISSFIIQWFPFLAIYRFGVKKSYVKILVNSNEDPNQTD